ncbi:hypothetical protein G9A89_016088 [Geosiphon pyriformis]|nr:hypothetical protein G9A89_016088 [Geosiphon pyriformis]
MDKSLIRTKLSHPYKQIYSYERKRKRDMAKIGPDTAKEKGKMTEIKLYWANSRAAFKHCPMVLLDKTLKTITVNNIGWMTNTQFEVLQKTILKATFEFFTENTNLAKIDDFTEAQF